MLDDDLLMGMLAGTPEEGELEAIRPRSEEPFFEPLPTIQDFAAAMIAGRNSGLAPRISPAAG